MKKVAIIGGTGLSQMEGVEEIKRHQLATDYGDPSSAIRECRYQEQEFFFLPRHGDPHRIAPHKINYRANIAALKSLEIDQIIAVNAVGGIHSKLQPKDIVIPDQVIDYTSGRENSFFDGTLQGLDHIDFSYPFDQSVSENLRTKANELQIPLVYGGVYAATQGPRLETAAEIKRLAQDGATIVGMTLMPEAALAREMKIAYASLCLVVNPAAGVTDRVITMEEIHLAVQEGMGSIQKLIQSYIGS